MISIPVSIPVTSSITFTITVTVAIAIAVSIPVTVVAITVAVTITVTMFAVFAVITVFTVIAMVTARVAAVVGARIAGSFRIAARSFKNLVFSTETRGSESAGKTARLPILDCPPAFHVNQNTTPVHFTPIRVFYRLFEMA